MLFVDTTVWSLALRRDTVPDCREVSELKHVLANGQPIATTGSVLQELLQGFSGPKAAETIIERFRSIPVVTPTRQDHIDAATLRNRCRRSGVQAGTIDVLIAQLCLRHQLTLLTTDGDFKHIARVVGELRLWGKE